MKRIILILVFSSLIACNNAKKKTNASTEPEQTVEKVISKKAITTENAIDIPNFKNNLLLKIQQYIISRNVLVSQRPNIVIKSVSMNDECSEMKLLYELKHENTWWSEDGEEIKTGLIDSSDFYIKIKIIEATEKKATVNLDITKEYLEK